MCGMQVGDCFTAGFFSTLGWGLQLWSGDMDVAIFVWLMILTLFPRVCGWLGFSGESA